MRTSFAVVLMAAALALGLGAPAQAKSFDLTFDRASARPGQVVTARGSFLVWPGLSRALPGIVVYLIPTRLGHADYNTGWSALPPPGSRGTHLLGRMREQRHHLFLRFTMPRVSPGNYTTATWCPVRSCGEGSRFSAAALWGAPWAGRSGDVIRVTR